ncbi:MAG: flagellar M-ring protein FliF [Methylobacteriaceae bacterium]|nr:flagellar M-ring protein FliF [Rhodoblastus sp.]MCC0004808.1 flagellar M-ring protein FliF [Methylobacteriaceae bacterium]
MLLAEVQKVLKSLGQLGPRRLWQLGLVGVGLAAAIALASYFATRPAFEVLYSGLDAQDLARITGVLRETNVPFDVTSDGGTLLVENGQASRARMVLAERGLPRSATAGYELFDKLGSLGLTSFMQEVTRVRALEGELARSIQTMQGVRAARVHIAPQDDGGFRHAKQAASASVVVRLSSSAERSLAQAIRRLVSSATPGLAIDAVTVLNADGTVLASGGESEAAGPLNALGVEKSLSDTLQDNIRQTLAPVVGVRNLNVSVALRLNTDKRQVNETIFNPESRVERSIRVIKENQAAHNSNSQLPASVERNIPNDKAKADGKVSNEENSKKEELTNYEISSKSVQTVGTSYAIERMSVAVLINKAALLARLGEKGESLLDKRLGELTELASTAVGFSRERGDTIKLAAIEFSDGATDMAPVGEPGFLAMVGRQFGAVLNALAIVVVALVAGGVASRLLKQTTEPRNASALQIAADDVREIAGPTAGGAAVTESATGEVVESQRKRAQKRLEMLVEADEEQAAQVIKGWLRAEARGEA